MDKRRKISVKEAKQIAYEAMHAALTRQKIIDAQKVLTSEQYQPFEKDFDNWFDARVSINLLPKEPDPTPPKFVKMGNTSLRLVGSTYYRDAGDWGVQYRYIHGELVSWAYARGMPQLHKVLLVEITEEEWREGNGQYAPETLEDE